MNTDKTELLCVSKENENFDPIVFRGQENKPRSHGRYLGIMIDSNLSFNVQLSKVLSNMAAAIRSIYLIKGRAVNHYNKEASKNGINFRVKSGLSDHAHSLNAC